VRHRANTLMKFSKLLAICLIAVLMLNACAASGESSGDSGIKVEFKTEPAEPKAGQEAKLVATITGLKSQEGTDIYFEVKKQSDKKRTVIKLDQGTGAQGVYTAKTTFAEATKYDVYIHVVAPDAHETVKKPVTVTAP